MTSTLDSARQSAAAVVVLRARTRCFAAAPPDRAMAVGSPDRDGPGPRDRLPTRPIPVPAAVERRTGARKRLEPFEDFRARPAEAEKRQPRRDPVPKQEEGIAYILDDPERLRELREQLKTRERKVGRHHRRSRGLTM